MTSVDTVNFPRLSRRSAFIAVAGVIGLCLAAATAPSPLYKLYQLSWGIPTLTLTLVYAVYCFGVLAALLLFGRLSDIWGRRPVIIGGLLGLLCSMGLFVQASSVGWLFIARSVQGLSTGIAISAAGAALLELESRNKPGRGGLMNAAASSLGVGCGGMLGAVLVEFSPDPFVFPFAVLAVLVLFLIVVIALMPESVTKRGRDERLRWSVPQVPRAIWAPFTLSGLAITTAWANVGLFQSLVPTLAPTLLQSDTYMAAGISIFALGIASACAPVLAQKLATYVLITYGMIILVAGVGFMALSLSLTTPFLFITASLVIGAGVGLSMVGSIRLIGQIAPPAERASVMAAFYIVAYIAISAPAIIVGYVVQVLGTTQTFHIFACAIVLLSIAALLFNARVSRSSTPVLK